MTPRRFVTIDVERIQKADHLDLDFPSQWASIGEGAFDKRRHFYVGEFCHTFPAC
jgi:hypothetical protein